MQDITSRAAEAACRPTPAAPAAGRGLRAREPDAPGTGEAYARQCDALADAQAAARRHPRSPVLLVTGDEDAVAPPQAVRAMAERLHAARSTRVVVLPRCGHWTPVERPDECQRELRDFLVAQRQEI
jgi:3-oxoadipate enol-lactonase